MGKHSSDSDSEKRIKTYKNRSKRRSSSSSSSDSRRKHKRKNDRSRSRDRYSRSRRSHSSSSKSKSRRRSRSKDRSRFKDRHHRSRSRSKYRRSRSRSYIREYTSKTRKRSSSSSSDSEPKHENIVEDKTTIELKKSPDISKVDSKTLNAINEDSFTPKTFTSSSKSKKMMENIVIDLKKQTIKIPEVEPVEPDSIFHHNLFLNEEARMEKWIKELYGYRQRALQQGLKSGEK